MLQENQTIKRVDIFAHSSQKIPPMGCEATHSSLARPIPGQQKVNGNAVKDEAIADMGGVKSVLYAVREIPDEEDAEG